jgi:hypothetical protein
MEVLRDVAASLDFGYVVREQEMMQRTSMSGGNDQRESLRWCVRFRDVVGGLDGHAMMGCRWGGCGVCCMDR